jgi:hypothetical protein
MTFGVRSISGRPIYIHHHFASNINIFVQQETKRKKEEMKKLQEKEREVRGVAVGEDESGGTVESLFFVVPLC